MQQALALLYNPEDINSEGPDIKVSQLVPFIEEKHMNALFGALGELELSPHPWVVKSHLSASFYHRALINTNMKVILMLRNPKDTLVGYYKFYQTNKGFGNFKGSWNKFFNLFQHKKLAFGDFFEHTLGWWGYRQRPNTLVIKFEDLYRNPQGTMENVVEFLELSVSPSDIADIICVTDHVQNKGEIGIWELHFTVAQNKWFDELYRQQMEESGLSFDFTIEQSNDKMAKRHVKPQTKHRGTANTHTHNKSDVGETQQLATMTGKVHQEPPTVGQSSHNNMANAHTSMSTIYVSKEDLQLPKKSDGVRATQHQMANSNYTNYHITDRNDHQEEPFVTKIMVS